MAASLALLCRIPSIYAAFHDSRTFGGSWEKLRDGRSYLFRGKYSACNQEDAAEFAVDLIDFLSTKIPGSADFGVQTAVELICKTCASARTLYAPKSPIAHVTINLDRVSNSLQQSLSLLATGYTDLNGVICERCDCRRLHRHRDVLHDIDKFLIVHVKRFLHSGSSFTQGRKLSNTMRAELQIDLRMECGTSRRLHLRGIIEHRGVTLAGDSNHYVSYVHNGECWYFIDGQYARIVDVSEVQAAQVYLALYEQDD